jgi:hypothetical protein
MGPLERRILKSAVRGREVSSARLGGRVDVGGQRALHPGDVVPGTELLAHDLTERLEHETAALTDPKLSTYRRELPIDTTQRPNGALPWENTNRDLIFVGHGSNVSCLVGEGGLEPPRA